MRISATSLTPGVLLVLALTATAAAAAPESTAQRSSAPTAEASADSDVLKGTWVRPDGGYTIVIKNVSADGRLEAMYFNPSQLPFARAEVSREGGKLHAFFELRAGGYDGSTYDLSYDPASDRLSGIYYQAVAKQKFDIFFERRR